MLKRAIASVGFCLFLLLPVSSWALDEGTSWRNLSPKEREDVLRNYQRWQNLSPRDKEHLREEWNRWQSLPRDRRDKLRQRYDELHKLSPREQRTLRERSKGKKSRGSKDLDDDR